MDYDCIICINNSLIQICDLIVVTGHGSINSGVPSLWGQILWLKITTVSVAQLQVFSNTYLGTALVTGTQLQLFSFNYSVRGSQDVPRNFLGLSNDFLRTFCELSQDFPRTFSGLSQDFLRTFSGLS